MDCLFNETKCLGSYRPGRGTRNEEIKVPWPTSLIKVSKQDVSCCVCVCARHGRTSWRWWTSTAPCISNNIIQHKCFGLKHLTWTGGCFVLCLCLCRLGQAGGDEPRLLPYAYIFNNIIQHKCFGLERLPWTGGVLYCVCARVGQAGSDEPPLLPTYLIISYNTGVLG